MTNDLKNFLEEETQLFENRYKDISTQIKSYGEYCDVRDFNTQSNKRIVNKVLDLVEKEVENIENPYSSLDSEWYEGAECMRRDISTVINSLVAYALNVKIGF